MSMFPTNILVAIDGSDSSDPALRAAELSEKTGSEVNVLYVGKDVPAPAAYNEPSSSDQEAAQKAQELLDDKARQVEEAGGGGSPSLTWYPGTSRPTRYSSSPKSRI